jgi:hypothetical protein
MNLPEFMKWIDSENRYGYLGKEDSARLKKAIESGEDETASLLIRIATASRSEHCSSTY